MAKKLEVYGLSTFEYEQLRTQAEQHGEDVSVSQYVKALIMNVLQKQELDPSFGVDVVLAKRECDSVIKPTLRLNATESAFITEAAEKADMSTSAFIRLVLRTHIGKVSILNNNEVTALYQSNYQLRRIGQNLNQIAHALNAMQATTVTTDKIAEVETAINAHIENVQALINANQEKLV